MVKLKKKRCPCIAGYDIRNGDQKGEDFSAQATPAEIRRVWNALSKLEAERVKEGAMVGSDWRLNGRKYLDLKYTLKNDTTKHWQSIKHALKNLAAVQVASAGENVEEQDEWELRGDDERIEGDAAEQGGAHQSISCLDKGCTKCVLPRNVWNDGEGFKLEADGVEKSETKPVKYSGICYDIPPTPPVLPPRVQPPPPPELPTPLQAMDVDKYYQDRRDAEEDERSLRRVLMHSRLDYRSAREMDFLAAGDRNRAVFGAIITEECNDPTRVEDWRTEAEGFVQRMRVQANLQRAEIAMEGEEAWAARVRADRAANPMPDAARVRLLIRLGRANRREMTDEARTALCVALARANEAVDGGSDYVVTGGGGAGRNQGSGDSGGFTGIGDRVEADQISVAVTEGEIESQVKAVEVADTTVQLAAAVFNANGGFSRPLRASTTCQCCGRDRIS
jgi:hypothetical protein